MPARSARTSHRRQEVVVGRDQIGLRDPDRRLRAALGLRIARHTRRNRQPVVAADGHDLRVADRDPADMIDRHRLLVIGQRVGRRAAERAQRAVDRHHHRRHRPIAQRDHDPEPRPRQPRTEQRRRPAADDRAVAIVPLHPQPGLGHPRPCPPPMLGTPPPLGVSDRPPGRALRTHVAHRDQPLMRLIRADLPPRAIDPLLDLDRERIDLRPGPRRRRQPAARLITGTHPMRDRLVITPRQHRRATQRAGQVIRLQNLHHFLRVLQARRLQAPRR